MKIIYAIIGTLLLAYGLSYVVSVALERDEVKTCHELSREAREFPTPYRAWQEEYPERAALDDEMCAVHGITITTYPY